MSDEKQAELLVAVQEKAPIEVEAQREDVSNLPALSENYSADQMISNPAVFEHMQRAAKLYSVASLVPDTYKGSVPNCFIAMQYAEQLDVPVLTFMQKSYIVGGKPAIEGQLAIALLNRRGPWLHGVQYEYDGEGDLYGCTAFGVRKDNGKTDRGTKITIKMAKDTGWWTRNKLWQSLTDQMLGYRAAAFLGRMYCPEVLLGLDMLEERIDIGGAIETTGTRIENVNQELLG